jgi:hypothetical protein
MIRPEIFTQAAELIKNKEADYCCIVLEFLGIKINEMDWFIKNFKPDNKHLGDSWFGMSDLESNRTYRVYILHKTAKLAEKENLKCLDQEPLQMKNTS